MKYLAKVDYADENKNHVTTLYKIVEAPTELDASLKILLNKEDAPNIYEQMFLDGFVHKTLTGIFPINERGEAFDGLPKSMIGDELGEC